MERKDQLDILKIIRAGNIEAIKLEVLQELTVDLIAEAKLLEQVEKSGVEKKPELASMKQGITCSRCGQNYHSEDIGFNSAISLCNAHFASKLEGIILLKGHIEKETDFWVTVHCPNSGMIFDFMKKDLAQAIIKHLT